MAAIYTFKELQDQVLATLDESGDTSTTQTLVKNYLNQAQQTRLASADWPFLRWPTTDETITIIPQTRFYTLHPEFWRAIYIFNTGTREYCRLVPDRMLPQSGNRWLTDTGRARDYRWTGYSPVQYQPNTYVLAGSTLTLTSSSGATDATSAKAITFTGISGGLLRQETVLAGSTSTLVFTKLLRVTFGAAWAGTMTLKDSAAHTLLTLGPGDGGRLFPQIEFLILPDTADSIVYAFYRQPLKMVLDGDLPEIPPPHSQILVWDTLLLFAGYNTDLKAGAVAVWRDMRDKMDTAMREDFLEGQELESMPRLVRDVEDMLSDSGPRVFSS